MGLADPARKPSRFDGRLCDSEDARVHADANMAWRWAGRCSRSLWTQTLGGTTASARAPQQAFTLQPNDHISHHRQHAGRADAVRRLARDDAPGAVPEARAGHPQSRLQRRRDRDAAALEELRHARRVAERRSRSRSAATRTTASPAPTRRPTSSSRSSATTSRTPGRPGSTRSRSSWATGSRTRWRRSTTASPRRASCCSRRSRTRISRNPDLPDGKENNQRLALYTQAMGEVAAAQKVHVRRSLHRRAKRSTPPAKTPLTINGVHLNAEGNRQIAAVHRPRRSSATPPSTHETLPDQAPRRPSSTRTSTGSIATASPTATRPTAIARS